MRILHAMNAQTTKKPRKAAINLTLSKEAVRQGKALVKVLKRPSLSNVVEYLIEQAASKEKAA